MVTKKFHLLFLLLFISLSVSAEDRIAEYVKNANRCAKADLTNFKRHLCREYRVDNRDLEKCYNNCNRNWGNVSVALEVAKASGKDLKDICDCYRKCAHKGWKQVCHEAGIKQGTACHRSFCNRIHKHNAYCTERCKARKDNCYRGCPHRQNHHRNGHHCND